MKPTWPIQYKSRLTFPSNKDGRRLEIIGYNHSSHQGRIEDVA